MRAPAVRPCPRLGKESGQAIVLLLAIAAVLIVGALVLGAFGQALTAKGRHQRAADLASISAAHAMRAAYPRLFEPVSSPRHLDTRRYLELARQAALRAAQRNGVRVGEVRFSGADELAPLRVTTSVRGAAPVRVGGEREAVEVRAEATAEIVPLATGSAQAPSGREYGGPFAYRQGERMRPDVAQAFDRLAAAAKRDAGISLTITSAFRSDAEQARLYAANPNPRMVARPGESLHRYGTELDLGPPAAYSWLARNAERFGFIQRYSWEPWHYGYTRNPGTASVGFGQRGSRDGSRSAVPSFVPSRYADMLTSSARRWSVSAGLLAAQIQAESGFDPRAVSPAGARGIAQFMPATARSYGLDDPFDPGAAIDAQAHLMRDLLRRFASVPLALAAYNAGPGAVAGCGCVPPFAETRAYVARILALLGGGAGEASALAFEVRLVK